MSYLIKSIRVLLNPLIGSGIGNYFPFSCWRKLYEKIMYKEYKRKDLHAIDLVQWPSLLLSSDSETLEKHLFFDRTREPYLTSVILNHLRPWDRFIDVWANIGYYSIIVWDKLRWTGQVIWFEPSNKNYAMFQKNIAHNWLTNVQAVPYALGSTQQQDHLYIDNDNPWKSSVLDSINSKDSVQEIEMVTLDTYLWNEKRADLIKIDIEWYEYEALLGMKEVLTFNSCLTLILEFSPGFYQKLTKDVLWYGIWIFSVLESCWFDRFYHVDKKTQSLSPINLETLNIYIQEVMNSKYKQSDIICYKWKRSV